MFTTELRYIVVRYMLNELADEAANVGIVAVTSDPPRIIPRFLEDPTIKSRSDARVKKDVVDRFVAFLEAQKPTQEEKLGQGIVASEAFFDHIREFGAGLVRTSLPRSVLTNDVEQEISTLYEQLVSPARVAASAEQRVPVPRDPLGALRRRASRAVVKMLKEAYGKPLDKRIVRPKYEVRGVLHKNIIDVALLSGTKRKAHEHLFQHVLHLPDAEASFDQAAALCYKWNDISERNGADRDLTAMFYERSGRPVDGSPEATRALRKEDIQVARPGELPKLIQKLKPQPDLI